MENGQQNKSKMHQPLSQCAKLLSSEFTSTAYKLLQTIQQTYFLLLYKDSIKSATASTWFRPQYLVLSSNAQISASLKSFDVGNLLVQNISSLPTDYKQQFS